MRTALRKFWTRDDAATSVEYAVMLALILMVVIGAIEILGTSTKGSLDNTNAQLTVHGFGAGS
jgi:Flp pilus assembly pilin Flp